MKSVLTTFLLCLVLISAGSAQTGGYDGLKLLGMGATLANKESDATLKILGFQGKYEEKLVGVYLTQHGKQVRFYMDRTTWDQLKQTLLRSRDQWETLAAKDFKDAGAVRGFRVANIRSEMRISLQGENALSTKRLNFSLTGGGNTPMRTFISLPFDQVKLLVDQLHQVDQLFHGTP